MENASQIRSKGFRSIQLDSAHRLFVGKLPPDLRATHDQFETLWAMHPAAYHQILMHGKMVATPRWQQAYGKDYHYTGQVNNALPIPPLLQPLLAWCQSLDKRLNGLLLNWYDGARGHYIGKHRDSTRHLEPNSPIVTISLGDSRTFRLQPYKGTDWQDFEAADGVVFVMPSATNQAWTHEITKSKRCLGRRISVTARAFVN